MLSITERWGFIVLDNQVVLLLGSGYKDVLMIIFYFWKGVLEEWRILIWVGYVLNVTTILHSILHFILFFFCIKHVF